jgi:hypothetical protein
VVGVAELLTLMQVMAVVVEDLVGKMTSQLFQVKVIL